MHCTCHIGWRILIKIKMDWSSQNVLARILLTIWYDGITNPGYILISMVFCLDQMYIMVSPLRPEREEAKLSKTRKDLWSFAFAASLTRHTIPNAMIRRKNKFMTHSDIYCVWEQMCTINIVLSPSQLHFLAIVSS